MYAGDLVPFSPLVHSDELVIPASPRRPHDPKAFQDLLKRVLESLQIPLEEVQEAPHKLLDILHSSGPSSMALPINESILEPTKALSVTIPQISMQAEKRCFRPVEGVAYLISNSPPNLLVGSAAESCRLRQIRSMVHEKEAKRLGLFGRKTYSLASLQF